MKKLAVILLTVILLTMTVYAADPFTKNTVSPDTKLIDYTEDQGNNGQPIAYVENYGIGYTWINDYAYFEDLDFGANGADKATIGFTYGNAEPDCIIELYLDATDGELLGTFVIGNTGGFEEEFVKDFTIDVNIPSGVHTIYVKWTNDTGSLFYIQFNEAPEAVIEETVAITELEVNVPVTTAATVPQTSDFTLALAVVGIVLSTLICVKINKKRCN